MQSQTTQTTSTPADNDGQSDPSAKHSNDDLERMYEEGLSCDKELFSEQRSNILLSAGDHFTRKHAQWWSRLRNAHFLKNDQKIRITKNHTHKIVRTYINNIVSMAPGVLPIPNDPRDLQHIKTAELNKAVWENAKEKHNVRLKIQSWAKDFIEIGEVFTKVYWEPNAGRFIGYEQATEPDGSPSFDQMTGQPVPSEKAVFTGDLLFKKILPANVIRAAEAKTIAESKFLCIREMVHVDDLKLMVGDDEEKLRWITETVDETFFVFDATKGAYGKTKHQTMVKEYYFRPCMQYPNGYFYIKVKGGILFEGELPFGIYPLLYGGFDEISTTPRHRSIIKQLRPIQSEINRAASSIAEHQITLGEDKVVLQNGSKVTTGPHLPGIRTLFVTGQAPTIMEGRTGEQYLGYVQAAISELYQVANVLENTEDKDPAADPWANLYRSIRDKKKFSIYAEKFEGFLVEVAKTYLDLAKNYFDENMLIPAIGRSEYVNIAEFKTQDPLATRIKVEPMSDDINTMMGKTLVFNHILQYVGNSLSKDDIGKILRQMPFANSEEAFDDFTLDFDTSANIILALDRGEPVNPTKTDNAEYILKRLTARQKKPDYKLLAPQIQNAYDMLIQAYDGILAQQAAQLKAAESQFIPSGGAMIKVDYYIPDPTNAQRSIRATLPAESVDWLIKQLAAQGSAQEVLQGQSPNVQSDVSRMIAQQPPMPHQLVPAQMPPGAGNIPNSPHGGGSVYAQMMANRPNHPQGGIQ